MAIEVFNRYEKKYMLTEQTFRNVLEGIKDHMVADKHNENDKMYKICNIYYDTLDDRLIRASIEKPIYKEKLRLRAYGIPKLDSQAFIEIKKKYKGIVNKRRTSMKLQDAYKYLNENVMPDLENSKINEQVLREIDYFKDYYALVPKLYLSYDRLAYFEKDDGDFRVTFDNNIITRRYDLKLEAGSYGHSLLEKGNYLMEIKTNGAVPLWFLEIISKFNIYPTSFSKYGTEYKRYILNEKGEKICLNQYLQQQQRIQSVLAKQC